MSFLFFGEVILAGDPDELEEKERRLAYVRITQAEKLFSS